MDIKRIAIFFEDSRLWLGGNGRCRLRKLAAFVDSNMACSNRRVLAAKKICFFAHAKPTDKEKFFLSIHELQLSTAPKLTCSHPFQIPLATVSLQKDDSFSKLRSLASALQPPFRTDSNPHRRYPETLRFPARPVT